MQKRGELMCHISACSEHHQHKQIADFNSNKMYQI